MAQGALEEFNVSSVEIFAIGHIVFVAPNCIFCFVLSLTLINKWYYVRNILVDDFGGFLRFFRLAIDDTRFFLMIKAEKF